MTRKLTITLALFAAVFFSASLFADDLISVRDTPQEPVNLIFDTDMGNDVDDALALAIIHNMVNRGKCNLLAVTVTKSCLNAARYIKAFNIQYGHGDVPVGLVKDGVTPEDGKYVGRILEIKKDDGSFAYPCPEGWEPEDSVKLLRKVLADAKDHSVVIAQVGFSTNLARLLDSPADDISPLTGRELAAKKVRLLSAMAGAFCFQDDQWKEHPEFNVVLDVPSAKKVFAEWPSDILFSGFELGVKVNMPGTSMLNDYQQNKYNILRDSYDFYRGLASGQPTWDLTSVLFVLRPEDGRGYYSISDRFEVQIQDDGKTRYTMNPNGRSRCFLTTPEQRIRVEEAFVNLCSEK